MACLEVILQNGTFGRDQAHVCREIHAAVWQLPDKALVNLQRTSYCVEEACRIDEVFVFAAYRVRDLDEVVHGSEAIKVYFAAETVPCLCRPPDRQELAVMLGALTGLMPKPLPFGLRRSRSGRRPDAGLLGCRCRGRTPGRLSCE